MFTMRSFTTLAVITLLATGCASNPAAKSADNSGKISVFTAFYPLQWAAQRVGGNDVSVTSLTPAGAEPHDLSLDAKTIEKLNKADVVLYLGDGFQPEVEKAVKNLPSSVKTIDMLALPNIDLLQVPKTPEGSEKVSGTKDPHVWLDPVRMQIIAKATADALTAVDPAKSADFSSGLQQVTADLANLNTSTATKLASCKRRDIVTSHAAFQYFGARYNLTQVPIAGVSPEEEPDAKTIEQIAQSAKASGATTVYFEDQLPSKLANTVAGEIGAKTDLLSALEFDPSADGGHGDYISVENDNADRLAKGLGCS